MLIPWQIKKWQYCNNEGDASILDNTGQQAQTGSGGVKAGEYFKDSMGDDKGQQSNEGQQGQGNEGQQGQGNESQQGQQGQGYDDQFKSMDDKISGQGAMLDKIATGFNGLVNFLKENQGVGQQQGQSGDNGGDNKRTEKENFSDLILNKPDEAMSMIVGKVVEAMGGKEKGNFVTQQDLEQKVGVVADRYVEMSSVTQELSKKLPALNDKDSNLFKAVSGAIDKNPAIAKDPQLFQATVGLAVMQNLGEIVGNARNEGLSDGINNPQNYFVEGETHGGAGGDAMVNPNHPMVQKIAKTMGINAENLAKRAGKALKEQQTR